MFRHLLPHPKLWISTLGLHVRNQITSLVQYCVEWNDSHFMQGNCWLYIVQSPLIFRKCRIRDKIASVNMNPSLFPSLYSSTRFLNNRNSIMMDITLAGIIAMVVDHLSFKCLG